MVETCILKVLLVGPGQRGLVLQGSDNIILQISATKYLSLKSWTYLSIIILVSDSREAAFVVNSVFRSSSLSCKVGKSLPIKDIMNDILENIFFL